MRSSDSPSFELEIEAVVAGHLTVAGVDEAGRGPWAGPVVAAAVVLTPDEIPDGLNDSKKLSEGQRERLFDEITEKAQVGIGVVGAQEIDDCNILQATFRAMIAGIGQLPVKPSLILVDGNRAPEVDCSVRTVIKGDSICLSIAAASVIAKVTRDRIMADLDRQFPEYGFARHKGYGTAHHQQALAELGPSPVHRRSYAPIRALLEAGGR